MTPPDENETQKIRRDLIGSDEVEPMPTHEWAEDLRTISDLAAELKDLSRERFLLRVTQPHLLVLGSAAHWETNQFSTLHGRGSGEEEIEPRVFEVRKRTGPGGNPFGIMITLGRAGNNDLVLRHPVVSKFHCYFREEGGRWTVADAGSTNGSTLDGVKLEKHRAQPLGPRARIELGKDLKMIFFLPADLYEELGRLD